MIQSAWFFGLMSKLVLSRGAPFISVFQEQPGSLW